MIWVGVLGGGVGSSQSLAAPRIERVTVTLDAVTVEGDSGAASQPLEVEEQSPWDPVPRGHRYNRIQPPARFAITFPRKSSGSDPAYSAFQLVSISPDGTRSPVGLPRYADTWLNASLNADVFPSTTSKKGLQVQMIEDALELGIQHAALNFNLSQWIDIHHRPENLTYSFGGETFSFQRNTVEALDRSVQQLSNAKVVVSLIVLAYASGDPELNAVVLHPSYDPSCPNHLGAFNVITPIGAKHFAAAMEFLAHRYCQTNTPFGRVSNFILGNEVNSHWFWSNRGRCTMEQFAEDYLRALRIAHAAIRVTSQSARVYVSLEHHWNIRYPGGGPDQTFPGRPFLEWVHQRAVDQGDFDWHVAFHPYPENLFECRTWLDKSATTQSDTPRITFKNIQKLTEFVNDPAWKYAPSPNRSYGLQTRRVILSEQGFHCVDSQEGEIRQAAAYAYAYRKVVSNPGIDAFILHRHVDHSMEGGLNLGLWTRKPASVADPDRKRQIYEVFQHADRPDWPEFFRFALPIIGLNRWEDL